MSPRRSPAHAIGATDVPAVPGIFFPAMTTAPDTTTCFRHPDRETGRHCTRCGRPACPECLFEASVGSQCVDCMKQSRPSGAARWTGSWRGDRIIVTKILIAINVAVFLYAALRDGRYDGLGATSTQLSLYGPALHNGDYYTLLTSSVVHYGFIHILFNMLILYQVGLVLEPAAGRTRYIILYVVSVLAGSAGAVLATPHVHVGGASGGVFGLAAAATIVMYRAGVRFWDTGFGPLLVINFILGFFIGNVAIGGHIGGFIGGALATESFLQARKNNTPALGYVGAAFVGIVSIFLALAVSGR
jgi:membrane associated rhomboid family serine protease